ncbi:putative N2,N2-dimethylguanosine tRNA methyltransferase [Phytophthora cinnamomi]|nr:putative N2,N2-dimethylguanosine tRNA methyltransferase [Phytophthora cinnamomi]
MHVSDDIIAIFKTVQVILAADCFYQSEDFEKVTATVALIFRCSASTCCRFFFTYQLRSIHRSIAPLLSRWGLTAKSLDKSELLKDVDDVSPPDFDSVYLYELQQA